MKLFFFILSVLSLTAMAETFTVKETNEDLNKDGKKDSIAWLSETTGAKNPSRLVIKLSEKTILDVQSNFCPPEVPKSDSCVSLQVTKKLSTKNEPLLELKSVDSESSSLYIYRYQRGQYSIISASGQIKQNGKQIESHNINYLSGRAVVTSQKNTLICKLKNKRTNEALSEFNLFSISNETICD